MIPDVYLTQWQRLVRWPTMRQVEQDLIVASLMVEIANDPELGKDWALRGGTALHKLVLPQPERYSEDLDYCRQSLGPIGEQIDALRQAGARLGLERTSYEARDRSFRFYFHAPTAHGGKPLRIKVEINQRETEAKEILRTVPLRVMSPWLSGTGAVLTYSDEELLASKTRALFQRRKGRDLFDIWLGVTRLPLDVARVGRLIAAHYLPGVAREDFLQNLEAKLGDRVFLHDLDQLVPQPPVGYSPQAAGAIVAERLLLHVPTRERMRVGRRPPEGPTD